MIKVPFADYVFGPEGEPCTPAGTMRHRQSVAASIDKLAGLAEPVPPRWAFERVEQERCVSLGAVPNLANVDVWLSSRSHWETYWAWAGYIARMEEGKLASLANRPADDGELARAQDLADAKAWLCKRWHQDHPNEQNIRQLADYAAYLRLPPQPEGVKRP